MINDSKYSPATICQMLNIAKTTLYRWEQEGKISPVPRDLKGERQYSNLHLKELANIQLEALSSQYDIAAKSEDIERMSRLMPEISKIKILYLDDPTGLHELRQYSGLSESFVYELLQKALQLRPTDTLFQEIIELLYHRFVEKK